jgi:hypothetical protein
VALRATYDRDLPAYENDKLAWDNSPLKKSRFG